LIDENEMIITCIYIYKQLAPDAMPIGGISDYPAAVVGTKGQYSSTNLIGQYYVTLLCCFNNKNCPSFIIKQYMLSSISYLFYLSISSSLAPIVVCIGSRQSPSLAISGSFMFAFGGGQSSPLYFNNRKNILTNRLISSIIIIITR
jgi:hypothetical protein